MMISGTNVQTEQHQLVVEKTFLYAVLMCGYESNNVNNF